MSGFPPALPANQPANPTFRQVSVRLGLQPVPAALLQPLPAEPQRLFSPQDLFVSRLGGNGQVPALKLFDPVSEHRPLLKPASSPGHPPIPKAIPVHASSPVLPVVSGKAHASRGTGYYPHNNRMEGGFKDMKGKSLNTLQDFLAGKVPYVSIALDENMYEHVIADRRAKYLQSKNPQYKKYLTMQPQVRYGDTFRIPELEQKYGRPIVFKAVDTGSAFRDKGFSRVDIANRSQKDTLDPTINGKLTLIKQ